RFKTAFQTSHGCYEFNRVPFGIAAGPAHFSRLMKIIFSDFLNVFVILFIDDLTIYSKTFDEHLYHLERTLKRIRRAGITLKATKCNFGYTEVTLLGHVVTGKGIKPSLKLLKAITSMSIPVKLKDVRAILGLSGFYRQFIPNYSSIVEPLNKLLRKNIKFSW